MRVLLTCKKRSWCGEMRYIAELAGTLDDAGCATQVAAPRESDIWNRLPVRSRRLVLHLRHDFLAWRQLGSDISSLRRTLSEVDLVHSNASWDTWLVAWTRALYRLRVPLIRTRHNLKPIRRHFGNRWLYRRCIDRLIAPSQTILEDTRSAGLVPTPSLRLARFAVHTADFDPARFDLAVCRRRLRSRLGVVDDRPLVVLAGRLVRRKRPDIFIAAALELCRRGLEADYLLVGRNSTEDPFLAELRKMAAPKPDRIHFLDFTTAMPELLAGCDVALLCSWQEPFGLSLAEAMAMELPVVASASGGPLEMMEDGVEGIFFTPGEVGSCVRALKLLLEQPGLRPQMGKRGRERILREFSWERCLAEHLAIYQEVCRTAGPGERQ